jgi:[FeFe] hydrogenase H-cluster maturation GTPase HydF
MGLNDTPSGERVHISFFGCTNVGKSSLINAFTSQDIAIVSSTKGTTTDPVKKSMELLPLGPVMITDTPGMDDTGELGALRMKKTIEVLNKTDIAILVTDAKRGLNKTDNTLIDLFNNNNIPYIIVYNKSDTLETIPVSDNDNNHNNSNNNIIYVSALTGFNINALKDLVATIRTSDENDKILIGDLVSEGDIVVLVVPIDKAAPKGRIILPQQQVIRDALDHGAIPVVCRDSELTVTLASLKATPKLVITDSQVFKKVESLIPKELPLTSFSILMARYKGNLMPSIQGINVLSSLKEGDRILISEGCTHHRQCGDIGSVKLPALIKKYTGITPDISFSSGQSFPDNLSDYKIIIHCGACMLTPRDARSRYKKAKKAGVPITNYGIAIAYMNGILQRSLEPLKVNDLTGTYLVT